MALLASTRNEISFWGGKDYHQVNQFVSGELGQTSTAFIKTKQQHRPL